jgi:reverse gyrase
MAHCFEDPNPKKKKQIYYPTLSKAKRTPTLVLERKLKHQISSQRRPYYAMETAGKQVDDEDLRELMKENGIGRPSTSEYY